MRRQEWPRDGRGPRRYRAIYGIDVGPVILGRRGL